MHTFRFTHIVVVIGISFALFGCQAWLPRQPAPAPAPEATPTAAPPTVAPSPTATAAPTATPTPTPAPTPTPQPTPSPTQPPVPAADDAVGTRQALLQLHNQVRRGYDLPFFTLSPALEQVAQKHAEYLAGLPLNTLIALGNAAQLGPDGLPPEARMRASGYSLVAGAENWGLFASWQDAFVGWLNDERQRQAILSPIYREIGIGIARHAPSGNYVFVIDYAAPR
ncbi:MAG: CAP domain-containing protein [Thermoflexales bacterium]|nr:CAP domain-containing protein [Thermoflexales bacterium]